MDLMTVIGMIIGLAAVYYCMYVGDIVAYLFNFPSFVLVAGGTIASTMISYPFKVLKVVPKALMMAFFPSKRNSPSETVNTLVQLSETAKRNGIDSLQAEIRTLKDRFMIDGIQMVIDNLDPEVIRDNLLKEILFTRKRHQQVAGVFKMMASFAPVFGLLGTLIGVVQVLRNLSNVESMGSGMAVAVITTFYGIFSTNFIFLPVSAKLTVHSEEELLLKEVVIEGILSIQAGEIPILVKKKLEAFLAYKLRKKGA